MKAINLSEISSGPAPFEWETIPEVRANRPKVAKAEISLQKLDGLNVCLWMARRYDYWEPASDFFHVTE